MIFLGRRLLFSECDARFFLSLFLKEKHMTEELDNYYLKHPEPFHCCLLALRDSILKTDAEIVAARKYQIPFFYYRGLKLAFLWIYRKKVMFGIVTDLTMFSPVPGYRRKDLIESILIDPNADLPIERITGKLQEQMTNCQRFLAEKGN